MKDRHGFKAIVYVYKFDEDRSGKPLNAVVDSLDDIPEGCADQLVGEYQLVRPRTFRVRRELYDF